MTLWQRKNGLYTAADKALVRRVPVADGGGGIAPDGNDVLVYKFSEATAPFVNTGTVGASGNLALMGTQIVPNESDPWGLTNAIKFYPYTTRTSLYGANYVQPQPPMTVSLWLYCYQHNTPYTQHYITKQRTVGTWGATFSVVTFQSKRYVSAAYINGEWEAYIRGMTPDRIEFLTAPNLIQLNQWTHLGMTYDGATFIVYKDGAEVGRIAASGNIDYDVTSGSGPWFFDSIPSGSGAAEQTYGKIADARVATTIRDATWFSNVWNSKI